MRTYLSFSAIVAAAIAIAGASCSSNNSAADGGAADATADVADNDAEPAVCGQFTEAGAACPTVSPVRCFACGNAGGGCYCQATSAGPRWRCLTDPSCFPCALGDENCAPSTSDDGGVDGADGGLPGATDAGSD